jgi:hypothetical protein
MAKTRWIAMLLIGLVGLSAVAGWGTTIGLQATLDLHARTLIGTEDVTVPAGTSHAYFLLIGNLDREANPDLGARQIDASYPVGFQPTQTTVSAVEAVQSSGTTALSSHLIALPPDFQTYSLADTVLVVDLPPTTAAATLRLHFTTTFPQRRSGDQEIDQGTFIWRFGWAPVLMANQGELQEKDGVLGLASGKAIPLEFPSADYSARITVAKDVVLASGADHVKEVPAADASDRTYVLTNDGLTRSVALAAGPDLQTYSLNALPTPIDVFYLPGHGETARLLATYAWDILKRYDARFGPYPRKRLTIVEDPSQNGLSMAADGVVFMSSLFFTHRNVTLPGVLNRLCEFVLSHEIAHQWWGIGVGVDLTAQDWLSEGLAQYAAVSDFESVYGATGPNLFPVDQAGILENLVKSQFGFMNLREHQIELPYLMAVERDFDEPLIEPLSQVKYENMTQERLYDKGYLVARTIASAIGAQTFDAGLKDAVSAYMHRTMTATQFEAALEKASGKSLKALFDTWVFGSKTVDYGIKIMSTKRTDAGYETTVEVTRDGGCPQPVVVRVTLSTGKTVSKDWDGVKTAERISFDTASPVVSATIDPGQFTLDRDRLNNHDPVKFVAATNGNAFPLDAYLVRPDLTNQGVSISYLDRLRLTLSQSSASAEIYDGRSQHLYLSGQRESNGMSLSFAYDYTLYVPHKIGMPGTYYEPRATFSIAGYHTMSSSGALDYLKLGVSEPATVASSRTTTLSLDLVPNGSGRVSLSAFDEVRVFPQVYLQGRATVGTSFGDLPLALRFDLPELISFGFYQNGKWVTTHFYGDQKLFGQLALEAPIPDVAPYDLLGVAMVDEMTARLFVSCGMSWTQLGGFGTTAPNVEAGIEGDFELSALGGLLPFQARVGYATPVVGNGTGTVYFGFSL